MDEVDFFLQDPAWELIFWSTPSQCCLFGDNFCTICLPGPSVYLGVPCYCKKANVWIMRCHILLLCGVPGVCFQLRDQLPWNTLMWHCRTIRIPLGLAFPGGDVCSSQYEVTAAALSLMPCNHVIPHPVKKMEKVLTKSEVAKVFVVLNI